LLPTQAEFRPMPGLRTSASWPANRLHCVPIDDAFADVMAGNAKFAETADLSPLPATAAKGLAVVTCMDSRIDPLRLLGLVAGDAKILRNAGARLTEDVLRTLVLADYLLGVSRIMIVAHTNCRMAGGTEDDVHAAIAAAGGPDTRSISFLTTTDQQAALRQDVQRVRSWPYLVDVAVGGFIYDLATGKLAQIC
jgi:carbonic anhydrase